MRLLRGLTGLAAKLLDVVQAQGRDNGERVALRFIPVTMRP